MKSSDTSNSYATTGLGRRFDAEPGEWFLAKVTAVGSSGGFNVYTLVEVEPIRTAYGYQAKDGGVTVSTAQELNNKYVPINAIVMARFRGWNSIGETFEFIHDPVVHHSFYSPFAVIPGVSPLVSDLYPGFNSYYAQDPGSESVNTVGNLGRLYVPPSLKIRGSANVSFQFSRAAGGLPSGSYLQYTLTMYTRWIGDTAELTKVTPSLILPISTFADTKSFSIPLWATNSTGSNRYLAVSAYLTTTDFDSSPPVFSTVSAASTYILR